MNLQPISLNKTLEQKLEEELLVSELVEKLINSSSFFDEDLEKLKNISTYLNKNIDLLKNQIENFGEDAYFDDRQTDYLEVDLILIRNYLEIIMNKAKITTISRSNNDFIKTSINNEELLKYINSNIKSLINNPNELKSIISRSDDQDKLVEAITQNFPELIVK